MNTLLEANVLLLGLDEPRHRKVCEVLSQWGWRVWAASADLPGQVRLDVILTAEKHGPASAAVAGGDAPGVIRVGGTDTADSDLDLPSDATVRELVLSCRLMAEIVRLRRQQEAAVRLQTRLEQESLTDPFTGLPNRRAWDRIVPDRLQAAAAGNHRHCLAVLDIDRFKRINDNHGHTAGDAVLRVVGAALAAGLRSGDFVARLGGDEFGLCFPVDSAASAAAVVERVRSSIPSQLASTDAPTVTVSAGFALGGGLGDSQLPFQELLARADTALARAKQLGRDRSEAAE